MPEYRKKLIEVALPLEAINKESAREKSIRHGHPSTLHLWWARRPLAACRAVLFAQMVDDPSSLPDEFPTEEAQETERQRLFRIIEDLVKWESTTDEAVLHKSRVEIARSAARNHSVSLPHSMTPAEVADALKWYAPPVQDPFAGGGSIPLEAQRLGLEAHASDLNPVAVLINKALIEIPPKFAGCPPVNHESRLRYLQKEWKGAEGLAEDVRYYGKWIFDEAWRRIGHLYPKVQLPKDQGGSKAAVIAWIWARSVKCPNPACGAQMPLTRSFALSNRKGQEACIHPVVNTETIPPTVSFEIRMHQLKGIRSTISRQGAVCLACNSAVPLDYIRDEGQNNRMSTQLMAIVAEGRAGRVFLPASIEQETFSQVEKPEGLLDMALSTHPQYMAAPRYGMTHHRDLFTPRQLVALTTFADLVDEARAIVMQDSAGDISYVDAIATYLGLYISKAADMASTLCHWQPNPEHLKIANTFARHALSMSWDFAEGNPFSESSGNFLRQVELIEKVLNTLYSTIPAYVSQHDATAPISNINRPIIISTDPPYYDNVPYADLSDFFYLFLRLALHGVYPGLFSTMLVPKNEELVADQMRHGGREAAHQFFEEGLSRFFSAMREVHSQEYPLTVYYAFKQTESDEESGENIQGATRNSSTGWETMLEGLLKAGFGINGTWPMRTERGARTRGIGSNALASSIILVCRPRPVDAPLTTRRDFLNALKHELPRALRDLQRSNIAPVDLAQAAIGPGMAIFSRYSKVLESDGTPMRIRIALQLINQTLDEVLAEQEGEYDADTRWAVTWFEQFGMEDGPYGVAETLSKAKNTAVGALVEAGILQARGGKVRLLRRSELSSEWNPATAKRCTIWEVTQQLIRALQDKGDAGAAAILDDVGMYGEIARDLAYRLYTLCER